MGKQNKKILHIIMLIFITVLTACKSIKQVPEEDVVNVVEDSENMEQPTEQPTEQQTALPTKTPISLVDEERRNKEGQYYGDLWVIEEDRNLEYESGIFYVRITNNEYSFYIYGKNKGYIYQRIRKFNIPIVEDGLAVDEETMCYAVPSDGIYLVHPSFDEPKLLYKTDFPVDLCYASDEYLLFVDTQSYVAYRLHFETLKVDFIEATVEMLQFLPYTNDIMLWGETARGESFEGMGGWSILRAFDFSKGKVIPAPKVYLGPEESNGIPIEPEEEYRKRINERIHEKGKYYFYNMNRNYKYEFVTKKENNIIGKVCNYDYTWEVNNVISAIAKDEETMCYAIYGDGIYLMNPTWKEPKFIYEVDFPIILESISDQYVFYYAPELNTGYRLCFETLQVDSFTIEPEGDFFLVYSDDIVLWEEIVEEQGDNQIYLTFKTYAYDISQGKQITPPDENLIQNTYYHR